MRIRQFVFVARHLKDVVGDLTDVLGIEVAFNDPLVAEFGLRNAVMPVGDTFLEVVSPFDPKATAERYLERRKGDGGYMLILQSEALDLDRERLAGLGVRTIWKHELPDIRCTHLHPKDTGGTLLSLDDATPPESWHWAGPKWTQHVRRERVDGITSVELQSDDPVALARRWGEVLAKPVEASADAHTIRLDGGDLRFVADQDGRGEGLRGFTVRSVDRDASLKAAHRRDLPVEGDVVTIAGVRIELR